MDTLQERGVALGDRSRIRRYMLSPAVEHILAAEEIFGEISADRGEPPRRLQQSGGTQVNFESLAIALTGLLGLAGESLTSLFFKYKNATNWPAEIILLKLISIGYILQGRQATKASEAATTLARESESAQFNFMIESERRINKLQEVRWL